MISEALSLKISTEFSRNSHFPAPSCHFSALHSHILMSVHLSNNYHQLPENLSFTDILCAPEILQGIDPTKYTSVHCKVVETAYPKKEVKKKKEAQINFHLLLPISSSFCLSRHQQVIFQEEAFILKKDTLTRVSRH